MRIINAGIGFDIDKTLYQGSKKIDELIQTEIINYILKYTKKFSNIQTAKKYFKEEYQKEKSAKRVLENIQINNAGEIINKILNEVNIIPLIKKNNELAVYLTELSKSNSLFIISHNPISTILKKLEAIGIPKEIFCLIIGSDEYQTCNKRDGSAFKKILAQPLMNNKKVIFIGDNEKTDIIPAKENNIITIKINSDLNNLEPSVADYQITDIMNLKEVFEKIGNYSN